MTDQPRHIRIVARILAVIDRVLGLIERLIMVLVTVGLFTIMVLVSFDAILRYTINRPLSFSFDLVTMYLLPLVMLMPVGFILRRGGHISVDLFASLMPERMRQIVVGLAFLLAAPSFWLMFQGIGLHAIDSWEKNLATTGVINWPIWVHQAIFSIAMGGIALRLAHVGLTNVLAFLMRDSTLAIPVLSGHEDPLEEAV